MTKLKLHQVDYHRNGISGEGFHAILFTDSEFPLTSGKPFNMLATVFSEAGHVAVICTQQLDEYGVTFGINSFRGDHYEATLRQWIAEHNVAETKALGESLTALRKKVRENKKAKAK
jgi:hypothetical protein